MVKRKTLVSILISLLLCVGLLPLKALAAPAAPAAPAAAPGTAGELKLYDTDPRDAAMVMAIVADKLGKPLNELRFKSIREVKDK